MQFNVGLELSEGQRFRDDACDAQVESLVCVWNELSMKSGLIFSGVCRKCSTLQKQTVFDYHSCTVVKNVILISQIIE